MKNLKQFVVTVCLALFVLLINNQFAQAQETKQPKAETEDDSPSLQETFNWLKSKLENQKVSYANLSRMSSSTGDSTMRFQITVGYKDFKLDGCRMSYSISFRTAFDERVNPEGEPIKTSLNLAELDPVSVKVISLQPDKGPEHDPSIKMTEKLEQDVWIVSLQPKNDVINFPAGWGEGFPFLDRELAKRVAKAFQNAVKKCGGKVEPF